jgi:hypothetical protein
VSIAKGTPQKNETAARAPVVRMMMTPAQARQGDVYIYPLTRRPDAADIGATKKEGKALVLAYGEVTGHKHAIYPHIDRAEKVHKNPNPATLHELRNLGKYVPLIGGFPDEGMYLEARERCLVRHEEHDPISLAPGDYAIIHQHEHDGFEELRRVAD